VHVGDAGFGDYLSLRADFHLTMPMAKLSLNGNNVAREVLT
jgi:hypothetical protein